MKTHTLDLCDKRAQFIGSYDHEQAHRTSNMVDRLMSYSIVPVLTGNISMAVSSQSSAVYGRGRCYGTSVPHRPRR